jgi:putative endonuclease
MKASRITAATAEPPRRRRARSVPAEALPAEALPAAHSDMAPPWYLYLLECRGGAYYAGIARDVEARYQAHANGTGAKYTRANPPVRVLASKSYPNHSAAARAEWEVKQLPKRKKLAYFG